MKYVNVVIDNKSNSTDSMFTYASSDDEVRVGHKVRVPFARSRNPREGYVTSVINDAAEAEAVSRKLQGRIKQIESIDREVSLTEEAIRTALWMKGRYLCRYIDAIKCFAPAGRAAVRRETANSVSGMECETVRPANLTAEQESALNQIADSIRNDRHDRFLLHGVTGSGKTEVYIRAAEEALRMQKSVMILVPEISLTGQVIERFIERFGEETVALLHSRLSAGERYDQWKRVSEWDSGIVIGARSAAFAPVKNLGLAVIDEEHESTYKSDFTPKYDTVEVVLKRLQDPDNRGVLVLGSATPSVVTYFRAKEGIYKLLRLTKRYNDVSLPKTEVVDMRDELKNGNRMVISRRLMQEMRKQLECGRQVMLFLNRRGYSTFVSCRECGHVIKCPTCGLSLTFHKDRLSRETGNDCADSGASCSGAGVGRMVCHYCGHEETAPTACPECGSTFVRYFGSGTEKIEETVRELFPDKKVERVDLDSVKKKGELRKKLKSFEKGETRILIGTQLIAKGLDFRNVGLVGIISADVSLNVPDFRSPERAFQLITQAAGRAGRGNSEGRVIIQTYSPEHYAVAMAAEQNYEAFFEAENRFRQYMAYPPYSDIFQIVFTADSEDGAVFGARKWHDRLMQLMDEEERNNIFEPQPAYMSRIRDTYRYSLIIKCPKGRRQQYARLIYIVQQEDVAAARKKKPGYVAIVDINPYSFS